MAEGSDHKDFEELIAVHALGALPADEARMVEEHLGSCPACRAELDAYGPVIEMLASARGTGAVAAGAFFPSPPAR